MNIFADECVYAVTTNTLRAWGHDVETAQEAGLSGQEDSKLLHYPTSQNRILISIDMNFSNAFRFVPASHSGIIILKIRPTTIKDVHQVLRQLLENSSEEELRKSLVVVDRTKYRVRR